MVICVCGGVCVYRHPKRVCPEKIPCCTRYLSLRQWNASRMLYHLTPELHPHQIHYVPCSPSHSTHTVGCFIPFPGFCKAGEGIGCETERHLLMTGRNPHILQLCKVVMQRFAETHKFDNFVKLRQRPLHSFGSIAAPEMYDSWQQ